MECPAWGRGGEGVHSRVSRLGGKGRTSRTRRGDFFTSYLFAEAIRKGEQPYLDVYRGVAMSAVGIQAWRSCLDNGCPYEIPDFRDEEARSKYENDRWSPFPEDAGPGQPFPSIRGTSSRPQAIAYAPCKLWEEEAPFS